MKYEEIKLVNNEVGHRFELTVEGYTAFIDYKTKKDKVYLIHTEAPEELKGKGVAEALVEKTLIYLEEQHLKLVPLCPYVQLFLKRHPDWTRLVAE
ncbi:GNAT family N-acetyltransferase [Pedobacter sp.]|jgi:predicted GNAT family acetyltransferase|uniref:GNAT family N-acetyltransferase n=1 Tax=Pedobacter sp. TaxID=1411316 RepID=UPI002BB6E996|nr:GNAT family N-acetyltransferase [Pedobacter sp.]HWW40931.1 GNAT family N-acetyltransferase [Pedobacter sp.]